MTDNHPITPPPELVQEWWEEADQYQDDPKIYFDHVAMEAARWGADQQLELDARWLDHNALNETHLKITPIGDVLKEAMRPKPPSLKGQALIELGDVYNRDKIDDVTYDTIRLALEQLND